MFCFCIILIYSCYMAIWLDFLQSKKKNTKYIDSLLHHNQMGSKINHENNTHKHPSMNASLFYRTNILIGWILIRHQNIWDSQVGNYNKHCLLGHDKCSRQIFTYSLKPTSGLHSKDQGSKFFKNVGKFLPNLMVTHPESSILHLHIVCAAAQHITTSDRIEILNKETAHLRPHSINSEQWTGMDLRERSCPLIRVCSQDLRDWGKPSKIWNQHTW